MDAYGDNLLLSTKSGLGPISSTHSEKWYLSLVVVGKFLFAFGIFISYAVLKTLSLTEFLLFVKLSVSFLLVVLHRPFRGGVQLAPKQWRHVVLLGVVSLLLDFLLLEALTVCGPVRTILLSQHSDVFVLAVINACLHRGFSQPSKSRGALFFFIGICCLLFFDHDDHSLDEHVDSDAGASHRQQPLGTHVYHHVAEVFSWLGLPDHKVGIALLTFLSFVNVFVKAYFKKVASQTGGPKRLYALCTYTETLLLLFIYLLRYVNGSSPTGPSFLSCLPELLFIAAFVFAGDFYIECVSLSRLDAHRVFRVGSITAFLVGVVIGFTWEHVTDVELKHSISTGLLFAVVFFVSATRLLVRPTPLRPGASKGNLIGYSTSGLPLYSFSDSDGAVPKSLAVKLRQYLRLILESPDSRNIFFYLCLNLAFTFVELLYGVWTNSLGLISDGFHMFFDCSALVLGLWASIASKWKATKTFSYGYGRIEVLSGFVNGLFLVVIAFFVFMAAMQRIFDPPEVKSEKLLVVSVAGLVVNLVGVFAFSHAHSHGGKSCDHGHSHGRQDASHAHSHGKSHSHSHGHATDHKHKKSANMQGVYLHVLADTLGSVGVITSSAFIQLYGWYIADPICSLFIAVMIFLSVVPLLKQSSLVLLQKTPDDLKSGLRDAISKVQNVEGVLSVRDVHVWEQGAGTNVGTLVVQAAATANEQRLLTQVSALLKEAGLNNLTVQVEKEAFYLHLSKISSGYFTAVCFPSENAVIGTPIASPDAIKDV